MNQSVHVWSLFPPDGRLQVHILPPYPLFVAVRRTVYRRICRDWFFAGVSCGLGWAGLEQGGARSCVPVSVPQCR